MTVGSGFLADLNAGDDSIGNVLYTNIATVVDELVQPYTTSFLAQTATSPTAPCSPSVGPVPGPPRAHRRRCRLQRRAGRPGQAAHRLQLLRASMPVVVPARVTTRAGAPPR